MTNHSLRSLVLPLAFAALAIPAAVAAQAAPITTRSYPELDDLHDLAILGVVRGSDDFKNEMKRAAALHAKVVEARPEDDERRYACLMMQASLLYGSGDLPGTRRFTELAAKQAEATGEYYDAASAYISAAARAIEADDLTNAGFLAREARRIANSWNVTLDERDELLERIGNAFMF